MKAATARLNRFAATLRGRGATVLFSFPPVPQPEYELHQNLIQGIEAYLKGHLMVPILDGPETHAYPLTSFFDTHYHLTRTATRARTEKIAESVRPHLVH
jgi:hypothetical protein